MACLRGFLASVWVQRGPGREREKLSHGEEGRHSQPRQGGADDHDRVAARPPGSERECWVELEVRPKIQGKL